MGPLLLGAGRPNRGAITGGRQPHRRPAGVPAGLKGRLRRRASKDARCVSTFPE
jgi:hypothetical protein